MTGARQRANRFSITRLHPGYAIDEVDAFLARVEEALAMGPDGATSVTADTVRMAEFATTRLQPGYDQREVDTALDQYERRLRERAG